MQKIDMVVCHHGRYFGLDFDKKAIREITFEEGFGKDIFDWDTGICVAGVDNRKRYAEMRGENGCGLGEITKKVALSEKSEEI